MTLGISGRSAENITLEAVRSGDIRPEDIRIHPDTLVQQAEVARAHANPQLAANLLRAAELTRLDDHRAGSCIGSVVFHHGIGHPNGISPLR